MRVRIITLVSLVLNVALAVALVTWMSSASNNRPRVVRPINASAINSNMMRPILKTNVLVRPQIFTWQSVESPDYAVYVENLRALGMPATTIRDIIVADVDQIFIKRRREEAAKQDVEWWRSIPSSETQSNTLARAQALEAERAALLTKLLGPDWDKGRAEQAAPVALTGPVLGNLSEEVKASVQDIAKHSAERVRDYFAQAETNGVAPNAAELAKMREETRQQLAAILNPQQLEEFLLRYSDNAIRLRQELTGLNATPEEFRSLFRAIDAIDREIQQRYSGDDAASQRARNALEQQRLAVLRATLGTDRFEAYQTVRDPAYRDALAVAQQAGGDENSALALYEINRATTDELNRIRNDSSLTDAQKRLQLQQAELEQQKARALVLGEAPPAETAAATPLPQPQFRSHVIVPFETLGQLSLRYGVGISAIREANPGVDINRVRPGTVINIPSTVVPPSIYPPGAVPR